MTAPHLAIIGAGPTGLGAAWRAFQLGHRDIRVYEAEDAAGGLSASFRDARGFTWDLGGHVTFSHFEAFDRALLEALGPSGWIHHDRCASVRLEGRWIPYPLQYNLHHLPCADAWRAFAGLLRARRRRRAAIRDFGDWIDATFGAHLAALFLRPYNEKVWGYPPDMLGHRWIAERVAVPDLARVLRGLILRRDDTGWGPNRRFRYPAEGGTGAPWRALAARLGDAVRLRSRVVEIDADRRRLVFEDGRREGYDRLLSTAPLPELVRMLGWRPNPAEKLLSSATHILGVGLAGAPPPDVASRCWMYFPRPDVPFYRATVLSRYSPRNVPRPGSTWSLLLEVSETPLRPAASERLPEPAIRALVREGLIGSPRDVVGVWRRRLPYGYPTPTRDRDAVLRPLEERLERLGISSRGRFGAWLYEAGNQDHSFMQGVEWAGRVLLGTPETVCAGRPEPRRGDRAGLARDQKTISSSSSSA